MATRRQFLEGAIAATATASMLAPGVVTALGTGVRGSSLEIGFGVFDERFAAGHIFADELHRHAVRTAAISGRVHAVWNDELHARWRDAKTPTVGITDARSLFLLEMMAADAGLRVIHRAHHIGIETTSSVQHHLYGPLARRNERVALLAQEPSDWARQAARIVRNWPNADRTISAQGSTILEARQQALDEKALISWIIC